MSTDARMTPLCGSATDRPRSAADADGAALPDGIARQALLLSMRLLDLVERRRQPAEMSQALAQVGRCLRALGAASAADSYLGQALRWAAIADATDAQVELLCERAELALAAVDAVTAQCAGDNDNDADDDGIDWSPAHGDALAGHAARERARDQAFDAATLATRCADPRWEAKVLLRVSKVLEGCGDRDDAAAMQQRALQLLGLAEPARAARPGDRIQVSGPITLM